MRNQSRVYVSQGTFSRYNYVLLQISHNAKKPIVRYSTRSVYQFYKPGLYRSWSETLQTSFVVMWLTCKIYGKYDEHC